MDAVDPTYPLYPIACVLASAMLLLVLMTSLVRQGWNLGVASLCFWLFIENLADGVDAVIWSDNADIKLYVYCDIVTHMEMITYIVKPMATLIITRRLYLIASLQSVELPSKSKRRWNLAIEWTLGLAAPLLVAGPIYYVNQGSRFEIFEGFGCDTADQASILEILVLESWTIIPPIVSIIFYYPKVIKLYYRQSRDINSFLNSNTSVPRTNYTRILVLASIDILLTLPIALVYITLDIVAVWTTPVHFPFYSSWTFLHSGWEPVSYSYAEQQSLGTANLACTYFANWTPLVLAFTIFALFGLTSEARASYWRIICTAGGWFGWRPTPRARNARVSLGDIEFGARPQAATGTSGFDLEIGSRPPSFVDTDAAVARQNVEDGGGDGGGGSASGSATDLQLIEEGRHEHVGDANIQAVGHRMPGSNEGSIKRTNIASARSLMSVQASNAPEDMRVNGNMAVVPHVEKDVDGADAQVIPDAGQAETA